VQLFIFGWRDVAEALVQAGVVEPAEVLDGELQLGAVRQMRSAISSVWKLSTNDSASALSGYEMRARERRPVGSLG
jgi:hypothetical protein